MELSLHVSKALCQAPSLMIFLSELEFGGVFRLEPSKHRRSSVNFLYFSAPGFADKIGAKIKVKLGHT